MNPYHSLKNKREFLCVYNRGIHKRNDFVILFKKTNSLPYNRYGVSVSKKVGNSVQRHRMARMTREAFRVLDSEIEEKCDYVLSWKKFDPSLKSYDLLKMIKKLNEKCRH